VNGLFRQSLLCAGLLFPGCVQGFAAGFQRLAVDLGRQLEIRDYPLAAANNSPEPYRFHLSVLGLTREEDIHPLLAIAVCPDRARGNEWMAVWNLSEHKAGLLDNLKTVLPIAWGAKSEDNKPVDFDFPDPYITWEHKRSIAWRRLGWTAAVDASDFAGLSVPVRFLLRNVNHFRADLEERRFIQVYVLLQLYEEVDTLRPSPLNLCPASIMDLKYHLLANRRALGILLGDRPHYAVVQQFESAMRERIGYVASYLHSTANLYHLGFEQVDYGLAGRPPLIRAGLLYMRGEELADSPPAWPKRNPFDLDYNPYTHPELREWMRQEPDKTIPLAFYVFWSDFRLKPVLVADFVKPGRTRSQERTSSLRLGLDNLLAVSRIPMLLAGVKRAADYGLSRKDVSSYVTKSKVPGIESARLFARMGWNFDDDINHFLLQSMEDRTPNPLAASYRHQAVAAEANLKALLNGRAGGLGLFLRILFEDRLRSELALGNRAIFPADVDAYEKRRRYRHAAAVIEGFNVQVHVSSFSWTRLAEAWDVVKEFDPQAEGPLARQFMSRLIALYPNCIPEEKRETVRGWLVPPAIQTVSRSRGK
jgi:hypothetical protein